MVKKSLELNKIYCFLTIKMTVDHIKCQSDTTLHTLNDLIDSNFQ